MRTFVVVNVFPSCYIFYALASTIRPPDIGLDLKALATASHFGLKRW